ncbi:MAG: hypothetical protein IT331_24155 [Anaerolineae bacterium]|nr:hypothetical protein [Anaerolineae bacterium]
MFKQKKCITVLFAIVVFSALSLIEWIPVTQAHGESAISVTPDTIAPGGKIIIKGVEMGANEEFKITLEGLSYQAELGDAKADDKEEFQLELNIPVDAPEGVYQVIAMGEDGDVVTTELTITPTKAAAEAKPTPAAEVMPSAEEHQLARSRAPLEVIGLMVLVVGSAAVGLFLVRGK